MNFDKTGYQLTLFSLQPSTSDDSNDTNTSLLDLLSRYATARLDGSRTSLYEYTTVCQLT